MNIHTRINVRVRAGLYGSFGCGVVGAYALDKLATSADVDATVEYFMYVNELDGVLQGVRNILSTQEDLLTCL